MQVLAVSILASAALAVPTASQVSTELRPFYLQLSSATNATLNSMSVNVCHVSTGLDKLCIDTTPSVMSRPPQFGLDESDFGNPSSKEGALAYKVPYGCLWTAISMQHDNPGDIGIPWFGGWQRGMEGEHFRVRFDEKEVMSWDGVYRWYVCKDTTSNVYQYEVLAWVYGSGPALNEGEACHPVTVTRVWPTS
jgi:hypothetical protein